MSTQSSRRFADGAVGRDLGSRELRPSRQSSNRLTSFSLAGTAAPLTVLVEQIAGRKALPDDVVGQIVDRTDGVPLFVEELTKSVLESGVPLLGIPTTLQDSLMARLDRLASVRRVAQIGAAIGREFGYELLRAVSPSSR